MTSLISVMNPLDILAAATAVYLSGPLLGPMLFQYYESWNTTLVYLEQNKEVFLPVKQFAKAIFARAVMILKPAFKAIVLAYQFLKPIIIAMINVTSNAVQNAREMGLSLTTMAQNFGSTLWDFSSSLAIVLKGFAQITAVLIKGLSTLFSSFENVFHVGYRILFHTRDVTWEDLSSAFIPLLVVFATISFLSWMKRPAVESTKPALRRSDRIARKRAMFSACA